MTSSRPDGLDLAAVDRHLWAGVIARSGELRAELIVGGRSNPTFLVSDDAPKWVVRRPPLHGTRVRAVLDWELSTVGDPLSDTALMCAYRGSPFALLVDLNAAWTSPLIAAGLSKTKT